MEEGFIVNSELYRLLMEYKGLDDDFINKVFEIIMKDEKGLEPFINDFVVKNETSDSLGTYSYEDKVITLYENNIVVNERIRNKKLLALQVLRHEIEHARNLQRLHECREDIESTVLRYSLKDYAVSHGLDSWDYFDKVDYFSKFFRGRRKENYDLDPGERIANIKSWKYIVNLIKNQRRTPDLLDARKLLFFSYINGYVSNGCYLNPPTYEYLLKMGMYHEHYLFKKRVEEKQYVLETRMMYGLPLSEKEYDEEVLKKVLLQKSKRQ